MPLNIDQGLKSRLTTLLTAELGKARVLGNRYLSLWSLHELGQTKSLPDKGKLFDDLQKYIGEKPFSTFVIQELDSKFATPTVYSENEMPLSAYEGYTDLDRVAAELVDSFESLPWDYCLTLRLPDPFGKSLAAMIDRFDLSSRHRLLRGSELQEVFPLAEKRPSLSDLATNTGAKRIKGPWEEGSLYLQISMEGYVNGVPTEPFLAARDDALTFMGLCLASGLLSEYPMSYWDRDLDAGRSVAHKKEGDYWIEQVAPYFDDFHLTRMATLAPNGVVDEKEARELLETISLAFRSPAGRNVSLSARWLFDSHCGHDELLQFVQATIAVEILLGDEEADPSIGLTSLMANRCAYSIAKTPTARTNLLGLFREIYKVRSKIVHRGKNRLNGKEKFLFASLQSIYRSVIKSDLALSARAERS